MEIFAVMLYVTSASALVIFALSKDNAHTFGVEKG